MVQTGDIQGAFRRYSTGVFRHAERWVFICDHNVHSTDHHCVTTGRVESFQQKLYVDPQVRPPCLKHGAFYGVY
jgi:hypothetical protein